MPEQNPQVRTPHSCSQGKLQPGEAKCALLQRNACCHGSFCVVAVDMAQCLHILLPIDSILQHNLTADTLRIRKVAACCSAACLQITTKLGKRAGSCDKCIKLLIAIADKGTMASELAGR